MAFALYENQNPKNFRGGRKMKKLTSLLGILVLVGAVAVPVFAWGPGWGHHMMGYWGGGPEYRSDYRNLTPEQRSRLEDLDERFYSETTTLRDEIWRKSAEIDTLTNSPNPDLERARTLHKEISELRAKLDEAQLNYEMEARKILPEDRSGGSYGSWYTRHMRGFGPGKCWN
jgi:zinc resistance-associated protein